MDKRWYVFTFSLLIFFGASAQEEVETDTLADPGKNWFQPGLYVDYGKALTTLAGLENKLELATSLLFFDKYEVVAEAGHVTLAPKESYTNADYSAEGTYLRLGAGYLIRYPVPRTRIGLGVRYGVSKFEDQGTIRIVSNSAGGEYIRSFERSNLESRWWEVVITSEKKIRFNKDSPDARINQLFSLGIFLRLKVLVTYDRYEPVDVYSIPGYGKSIDNVSPAANLFIKFTPF